jgi:uncharacterized protein
MATFVCDHCGKCCLSFGAFITLERKISDRDYYCRYEITNELFPVHIAAEDDALFSESLPAGVNPKSCPFLRKNPNGAGFACTIYSTRPRVCRDFRCYHTIVYNPEGVVCGTVSGRCDLKTSDENLKKIWKENVEPIPLQDHTAWMKAVIKILSEHGYRGEPVE